MLNYSVLNERYPSVTPIEPDLELIKFGVALKNKGQAINIHMYVGMLKFILTSSDIKKFEEEYKLLIDLLD